MKPKTDLLLNSACLFVISPLLGIMAVGFAIGLLEVLVWTIAGTAGLISSIFFDVDFTSVDSRMQTIRQVEIWLIFGGGTFGGLIWSCFEIKAKWNEHKATGKGW